MRDELRSIAYGYMFVSNNLMKDAHDRLEEIAAMLESAVPEDSSLIEQLSEWRAQLRGYSRFCGMPLELFHAYFVQAWYGFLDNIFERMLEGLFAGLKFYEIRPIPIKFKSSEDAPLNLANNIKQRVWECFSNKMTPDEKLAVITKALDTSIPDELKKNLRKHVMVRNVFQHNRGKLRVRDLKYLQTNEFKYPCIEAHHSLILRALF